MAILITDIARATKAGADDTVLNALIQQFIDDWQISTTVNQWRLDNYKDLRRWSYPESAEFLDAEVKLASDKTEDKDEGKTQRKSYTDSCLAVKTRFVKA